MGVLLGPVSIPDLPASSSPPSLPLGPATAQIVALCSLGGEQGAAEGSWHPSYGEVSVNLKAIVGKYEKSNKVPVVQPSHGVHPLTPLIPYSNEHFSHGSHSPHLPADINQKQALEDFHFPALYKSKTFFNV
uniref:Uncharacterized protein n=1 Tax=Sphaerodactylus townsendi TaxID=933632 RepID=A0ACB8EJ77_9SAUR